MQLARERLGRTLITLCIVPRRRRRHHRRVSSRRYASLHLTTLELRTETADGTLWQTEQRPPRRSLLRPAEAACGGHFPSVFRRALAAPWLPAVSSERLCAPPARCRGWQRGRRVQRRAGAPPISARPQRAAQGWSPAGGYPVGPPEALWADTVMPPFSRRARLRPADNSALSPARSRPYASRPPSLTTPLSIARR